MLHAEERKITLEWRVHWSEKRKALTSTSCLEGEGLHLRTCGVAKFWVVAEIQNLMATTVFFFFFKDGLWEVHLRFNSTFSKEKIKHLETL